ncbi:FdhD protein [Thermosporothrix hazakensis]|uniref:Sulfur carrier protein FdhD n=2 Tax=Thermosporothrix TaxID=768650 RepID=A0A326TQM6_THEHA|nr:formate dehydrogenase accessory sulfurtransferase FdhD [Thermosporothrix hazakensis]PZW18163.1 FdhD protein [Thermosporothrix hazakensis]
MNGLWRSPQDPLRVARGTVTHWQEATMQEREDMLAVEEPFEVRVNGESLAVIMRTPGHDAELAAGFLFTEGVLHAPSAIAEIQAAVDADGLPQPNVVDVRLQPGITPARPGGERRFAVSSSCGLCGKNSIADLVQDVPPLASDRVRISTTVLYRLPDLLREQQAVFSHTGSLHAAGLFSLDGDPLLLREDVGRHNAVDKLIGYGLLHQQFPFERSILLVSGRTSFEILQKALKARIPCVAAISAPSSLAVELAQQANITLIGFLRGRSMNVYAHPERLLER